MKTDRQLFLQEWDAEVRLVEALLGGNTSAANSAFDEMSAARTMLYQRQWALSEAGRRSRRVNTLKRQTKRREERLIHIEEELQSRSTE